MEGISFFGRGLRARGIGFPLPLALSLLPIYP